MFFMGTHKKTYENISHKKTYEKTLPMRERRDWHILKAAHKALYSSDWPLYVSLERCEHTRVLRSNAQVNLVLPLVSNTFQDCSASLFNSLPADIKSCTDHRA